MLVLLKKAIHVFAHYSEKGLNEIRSNNQIYRTTELEPRFKSEFSSSYFIWSTAHWAILTHEDSADQAHHIKINAPETDSNEGPYWYI